MASIYKMNVFTEEFELGLGNRFVVGLKDNIDVAGLITRAGSQALVKQKKANVHADVVSNLLKSDVKIVGKLNMHELAFGMTGVNKYDGTPVNPFFPHYITGGSSSGCAVAVAQKKVNFSIGTDTGGSIRVPAACCGVFGLKPTFERISRKGVMPNQSTLDCVGPLSLSAEGIIDAMNSIDETFIPVSDIGNVRLALVNVNAESIIKNSISEAVKQEFIQTKHINLLYLTDAFDAALKLMNYEMWLAFGHLLATGKLGDDVAQRLTAAQNIKADIVDEVEAIRQRFTDEVDAVLTNYHALVLPTIPSFPLTRDEALAGKNDLNISALTRPFNLSGHPAISLPLPNHLAKPVAMQLVGAKGDDELLCAIAKKISKTLHH
jgi:amidase